jgi:hypothetical protein
MSFGKLKTAIGALCLVLAGCGGGGTGPSNSAYEGSFSGTYTQNSNTTGSFSGNVQQNGNVNFSLTNTTNGQTSTVTGTVEPNGDFTGDVTADGTQVGLVGNFNLVSGGHMTANLVESNGTTISLTANVGS